MAGWNDAGIPKLWLYNLHYFEAPEPDLIERWIAENPVGAGNGWEPYPLSLRIANWIKWTLSGHELPSAAIRSLAHQAEYLSQRVEHHLLANHLFVNGKALVYGGAFFANDRWLAQGMQILQTELPEQILPDGAHFELSPLYHSLILEDVLDLVNLARTYPGLLPDWSEPASRMVGWLSQMTHPDGEIAFFNDAAFGIAPTPGELQLYAARLGIAARPAPLTCGYVRLENGPTVLLFDAAPIGPDYQPGHAHADTLSFELSHRGRRIVVNSGTSTYETGAERQRQRGTAAHSTVRVDGLDQSEVWGGFRVARRASPINVEVSTLTATAGHTGYHRLPGKVTHQRTVRLTAQGLEITDNLTGSGSHAAELFFPLQPGIQAEAESGRVSLQSPSGKLGTVRLDKKCNFSVENSTYHPEFGLSIPNRTISACWTGRLPVSFVTCFDLL